MKKVINRYWSQIVLDSRGVYLRRGILRRQIKFLAWSEIESVGFYLGDVTHVAYDYVATSSPPDSPPYFQASPYAAHDLFLYFSTFKPCGFSLEDILPVIRDEKNICINLGGGEFTSLTPIKKIADRAAEKILTFYDGKILNRGASYHN